MSFLLVSPLWADRHHPKIYDCFLFDNELELLEIKLNELYASVDHFVLVESVETHRGTIKPLYFAENKYKFANFLDKIIHVIVNERLETDSWTRENYQRNQILRGLTHCEPRDIIIIEDLDEIIRASRLPDILALLNNPRYPYIACVQTGYAYFLNRRDPSVYASDWRGSIVTRYACVQRELPQGIRNKRNEARSIDRAGWHFTSMGGIDRVIRKCEEGAETGLDNQLSKNPQAIRAHMNSLILVEIDDTFPQFLRDHISHFSELGFIDLKK
jgi:hypothetical protein